MCYLRTLTKLAIIMVYLTSTIQGLVNSPKIIVKDGHLIFESGFDRNISFRLKGNSRLNVNNEFDIIEMLQQPKRGRLQPSIANQNVWSEEEEATLRELTADMTSLKTRVFGENGLLLNYNLLLNRTRTANFVWRRTKSRIQDIETRLQALSNILETDNCTKNPCQNGGSCLNTFGGFVCRCPKNFEGTACEKDVNECVLYAGTDLGCQNGAQCINQFGSYSCICQSGWFGVHCTQRKGDCMQSSVWELCGHGTCVNNNDTFGYKCLCDQGWKTNGLTPACTVDVDECAESHTPCVTKCINLPGSFTCAPCSAGLTGNGVSCRDIDECATQNGGCSLRPKVSCINSYGSYHCGECPLGWSGDGHTCERATGTDDTGSKSTVGVITTCANNNICHPSAKCHEISNTIACSCPAGMIGSGIGINGCLLGTAKNCASQPCLNGGTCVDDGDNFKCVCPVGFLEPTCAPAPSPCSPNPCHNGARCHVIRSDNAFKAICDCRPGFRGEKCEKRFTDCSRVFRAESGLLRFPNEPQSNYNHNTQCAWKIKTNESQVLNVTFNQFEIEDSTDCRFDWLQINDGPSAGANTIGRFCGTHKPLGGNIISSSHQLYLWFYSDNSTSKAGFELEWNSIPYQCGGLINVTTHGTISSPGSPGNYPKNRDCRWSLKAANNRRLKLTFFSLQIENHDTCNYDYVEIIDAISGETLEKYCNSSRPQPLMLPTNEAFVRFHSDNIGSDTGFQLFYSTEPRTHNCGGLFTAKEGIIESPYIRDGSISCEYEIQMAASESITIHFQAFSMADQDCLEIYEVTRETNENLLQAKYCGASDTIPSPIHSPFNKMIVKFYGKPGSEFKLKYRTECTYNFGDPEGIISTPNYPLLSKKERHCTYKILTEPNTVITLHIDDFDLHDSSIGDTDCVYTSLKINDGVDSSAMGPYCGENTPQADLVSTANMLMLYLTTGLTTTGRGFKISYKAVPMGKTDCGGVYTKPGYTIRLPTDEENLYMEYMTCYWIIMAPKDKLILIDWLSFDLEESVDCRYDYLEIYDNLAKEEDKPLEKYCNAHRPQSFLSHARMLTVKFVSDMSDNGQGFEFTYKFVDAGSQCDETIYSSDGKLHTPNWPLNYTSDLDCTWIINTPPGTQMELQVVVFDVEASENCTSDWLEIRNGGNQSTLLGHFCGNMSNIPHTIPSFTNHMHLTFHSNGFVNGRGFQINWKVFSNACGGNLMAEQGVITSPYYPEFYPNRAECDWRIHVHPGSLIHLTIEDLALETHSGCPYDSLSIYDGATDSKTLLDSICQMKPNQQPLEYFINNNEALIQLRTDDSNRERGFLLSYRSNCSVTLTKMYGAIESPNYGVPFNDYLNDVNCTWTLKAPKGNRIQLQLNNYDTIDRNSVLDIRDGNNKTFIVQRPGDMIDSLSDVIVIKQRSNKFSFQLEYAFVGCINVFHANEGKFQSPNYPKPYPNNVECVWEIRSQPGRGIEISIESLDLEDSVNCTKDVLIISPHTHSDNVKERHCGKHVNLVISTASHRLFVRFISDGQSNDKGFAIQYTTKVRECGGLYQSKNGIITSPNYPNNYPERSDCEWTITVSEHHGIIFQFEELDLESYSDTCAMDYVEALEEGNNSDAEPFQLFKVCGDLDPNSTWRSFSNKVTIHFHSDLSISTKGFKLSFVEDCGERIFIDEMTYPTISFKKYAQVKRTCEWNLISKDRSKQVTLTFSNYLTNPAVAGLYRNEDDCADKGVVVYDGSSDLAPVRARFCTSHPPDITSNGNALTLKVPMDLVAEMEAHAYQMSSSCGNVYESIRGKFASPNYPKSYPLNVECSWYINGNPGNNIVLSFESMDLEESDDCNNDYVEVRVSDDNSKLVGAYCGNSIPPIITGFSNLAIHFRSNEDIVGGGFVAAFYYAEHNEINGTRGIIESPAYPAKFHSDEPYSWRITVGRDFVILLSLKHILDTDMSLIKFYDGYSDMGAPIDYTNSQVVRSSANILYFTAKRGPFQLEWQQVSKEAVRSNQTAERMSKMCGNQNLVIDSSLIFTSPGYPFGYASNLNCSWTIVPKSPLTHAEIKFMTVDLEVFGECFADYVKVSSSSDLQNWKQLAKLCELKSIPTARYQGNPYLKLEFVTDVGENKTGFYSFIAAKCGTELTDKRGFVNITTLRSNFGTYSQDCIWTIKVTQGRRIRLTFPDFWLDLPNTSTNSQNYFLVRNGIDEDSPFLGKGKYYENDFTDVLETSSNRAYIKFVRSRFTLFRASFHYEEISTECSREIHLSEEYEGDRVQTITTPNYPNIPNPHSECIWKIVAPLHKAIKLDFYGDYDLIPVNSDSKQCEMEYVQVNDGGTELAPIIGKYCGSTKPNTIRSTGNVMRILYFTDVSEPHKGFRANVSISRCGGTYYESTGSISEPFLQLKPKEKELDCVYTLEMPLGTTINVSIDKLNFEEYYNDNESVCKLQTHLELREIDAVLTDTENITDTLYLCGTQTNRFIVETNKLVIVLHIKNGIYTADSFKISYSAIESRCMETIDASIGILQTPNYPRIDETYIHCKWNLRAPKGMRIKAEVLDFDMGNKYSPHVFYHVTFANDPKMRSVIKSFRETPATVVYSTDNTMTIEVASLSMLRRRGLKLKYIADEYSTHCQSFLWSNDEDILNLPQTLKMKREDNNQAVYCSYDLSPSYNRTLSMQIMSVTYYNNMTLPLGPLCHNLSPLQLFVADERILPRLMCHNESHPSIRLPFASKLVLTGKMDNYLRNIELQLTSYECGGVWPLSYSETFVITQPQMNNHSGHLECAWVVWNKHTSSTEPPDFSDILLDFKIEISLSTNFKGKCKDEYLDIYNGPTPNSPHLGRYCEQSTITHFVAMGGVFLDFVTQNYNPQSAFNLTVRDDQTCGGQLTYSSVLIFDNQYKNNVECVWELAVEPGFQLAAVLRNRFFIESSPNCTKDYLKFQQKSPQGGWQDITTVCGRSPPPTINATTNEMRIIFRSDEAVTGSGFSLEFERKCGGIFYATDALQQISSPNYPFNYPKNIMCNYTIVSESLTESNYLLVDFQDFDVGGSSFFQCHFDNVKITTINSNDEPESQVFCDSHTILRFKSRGNISIVLQTTSRQPTKGFLLDYGYSSCGGVVTQSSILSSPNLFAGEIPAPNTVCIWQLKAPEQYKIIIYFFHIGFKYHRDCAYDGIDVYKGLESVENQRLVRFCSMLYRPNEINIEENTGLIRSFYSNDKRPGRFEAFVKFVMKCDNHVYLESSNSTYEFNHFSGEYKNNLDCSWLFTTTADRQLTMEFVSFHLETSNDCSQDYLKIYDGRGLFSDQIGLLCGHDLPNPVVSSKPALLVRFVTDEAKSSSGFVATIKAVPKLCGQQSFDLNKEEAVIIKSPDDGSGKYPNNINCIWSIKYSGLMHLHFDKFDIEGEEGPTDGRCTKDFLKISTSRDPERVEEGYGNHIVLNGHRSPYFHYITNEPDHIYCGNHTPNDFIPSSDVFIQFVSNNQVSRGGFQINATKADVCFRNFTGLQGHIELITSLALCDFYIKAPVNYTLSLYFSGANLLDADFIEIFDAHSNNSLQKLKGFVSEGKSLFTNTNELRVHYRSDDHYEFASFTYLASNNGTGCGGDFYGLQGLFSNPFYPEHVRNNSDCLWTIHAPPNLVVRLQFYVFDLGTKNTCHTDYLQIFEYEDGQKVDRRQFCGEDEPTYYKSQQNVVFVRFRKSVNYDGTGWLIHFRAVHPDDHEHLVSV